MRANTLIFCTIAGVVAACVSGPDPLGGYWELDRGEGLDINPPPIHADPASENDPVYANQTYWRDKTYDTYDEWRATDRADLAWRARGDPYYYDDRIAFDPSSEYYRDTTRVGSVYGVPRDEPPSSALFYADSPYYD